MLKYNKKNVFLSQLKCFYMAQKYPKKKENFLSAQSGEFRLSLAQLCWIVKLSLIPEWEAHCQEQWIECATDFLPHDVLNASAERDFEMVVGLKLGW